MGSKTTTWCDRCKAENTGDLEEYYYGESKPLSTHRMNPPDLCTTCRIEVDSIIKEAISNSSLSLHLGPHDAKYTDEDSH